MIKENLVMNFSTFVRKLNESKGSTETFETTVDEFFTWHSNQEENSKAWTNEDELWYIAESVYDQYGEEIGMEGARYLVKNKHKSIILTVKETSNVFENSFELNGVEYTIDSIEKFTNRKGDDMTAEDFGGDREEIINYLLQDPKIKPFEDDLYFDDADLVLYDQTAIPQLVNPASNVFTKLSMARVKHYILLAAETSGKL